MAFWFTCKIAQPIQPIWQHIFALSWSALKKPPWEFNFFRIFGIPSSSRHKKCCQMLEDFLPYIFHHSRHILCKVLKWTGKTLGNCSNLSFDLKNDEINFDLEYFNSTNNSDICPQVLTIKFKNNSGSIVYSNSHELNNRLNPNNCGGRAEVKKLKGKCLKLYKL